MSAGDYLRTKKLRKRARKDGRVDVVGTDITGTEYVAVTTDGKDVTPEDIAALDRGDPDKRDAAGFVDYFTESKKKHQSEYEDAMQKEYEKVMEEEILPGAFKHSPRQCGSAVVGTKVSIGGLSHPRQRCYFSDQGGCDWCY